MNSRTWTDLLSYSELAICVATLTVIYARRQMGTYKALTLLLFTRVAGVAICMPLQALSGKMIPRTIAYPIYFWTYYVGYALEAFLGFFVILGVYKLAMAPLPGLQRLGMLMFRWATGIAAIISISVALSTSHVTSAKFLVSFGPQLQQTQSVLTLCLLLFVCLAIRPMGLSHRSKIFGVSLGLGFLAATDLVGAAWSSHLHSVYSQFSIISGVAACAGLATWTVYFAMPEPRRRMIILPTTSPFLRWNQISLALGDEPGFVAVGEVSPEMFAPAEVEVMRRASMKIRQHLVNS